MLLDRGVQSFTNALNLLFYYQVLQTFLGNCMKEASKKKAKSIAFPAMGTGNLGYPKDIVAKEMFSAAADISKHKSSVQEVRFAIYEKDRPTLQASSLSRSVIN